jgi:hypothetical protein
MCLPLGARTEIVESPDGGVAGSRLQSSMVLMSDARLESIACCRSYPRKCIQFIPRQQRQKY